MSALVRHERSARRGITLIEVMVALGVLALVSALVYGAFDAMNRTRAGVEGASERYHQGRTALARISREVQSAFVSLHRPVQNPGLQVSQTIFKGTHSSVGDRLDFTSFSHRRLGFGAHESDQNELSYFLSRSGKSKNVNGRDVETLDLARRESTIIDMEPTTGGVVQILTEDVVELHFSYLDSLTGDWVDHWDTTQPEQFERLPRQVRIELVIARSNPGKPYSFITKVPIAMQAPLVFGLTQ